MITNLWMELFQALDSTRVKTLQRPCTLVPGPRGAAGRGVCADAWLGGGAGSPGQELVHGVAGERVDQGPVAGHRQHLGRGVEGVQGVEGGTGGCRGYRGYRGAPSPHQLHTCRSA